MSRDVSLHYVLIPSATFIVTAALLAYVVLQRVRSTLFSGLVALLCSILAWIGGMILGSIAAPDSTWASIGVIVHFAGVCSIASAFALLALRLAHSPLIEEHSRAVRVAMAVPSAFCFALVVTNPWHGLIGAALDGSFFANDGTSWRGPLYPLVPGWVYFATLSSLTICIHRSFKTRDLEERNRLWLITACATTPMVGYLAQNAGWISIPPQVPLATLCLTSSAAIFVIGVMRFGFLETGLLPLRSVIDQIADGLLLVDLDGKVNETNSVAIRLVGAKRSSLVGATLSDVLGAIGDDGSIHSTLWDRSRREAHTERIDANGRTIDVTFGWLRGRHGECIGGFAVLADRTDQQAHQQLRHRSQRLESMSVLLGGIAHEINNPLAYVRANLGHLATLAQDFEKMLEPVAEGSQELISELTEVIEDSLEGLERISGVVERTRSLAPREDGSPSTWVDLPALLESCIDLARRYTNRDVETECRFETSITSIEATADRLQQVFLNLLVNAHHALGSSGGLVRITVRASGLDPAPSEANEKISRHVEILIEDNGPGVADDIRERIFDPFFTTKGPDEGMGLGLSIVHDIVDEHGGELTLEPSALGGAAFCVRLPCRRYEP
jgi:PAS domain S-box-containing protein